MYTDIVKCILAFVLIVLASYPALLPIVWVLALRDIARYFRIFPIKIVDSIFTVQSIPSL